MSKTIRIENSYIALAIIPQFGGRITELICKKSNRNWLVTGFQKGEQNDEAIFGGDEATGWDECIPTVAPCLSKEWNKPLRDHGDLWARPCIIEHDDIRCATFYKSDAFSFSRQIELDENRIILKYELKNTAAKSLPFLWSQHCLLASNEGEKIITDGINFSHDIDVLRTVKSINAGEMHKIYGSVDSQCCAGIKGSDSQIMFKWKKTEIPYFGLWLDYGAWPEDKPVHQIALEPTTAPADDLNQAIEQNNALWLEPNALKNWEMEIDISNN